MTAFLRTLLASTRAATAVEYGLIVSLIVIVMVTALVDLGSTTSSMWNNVSSKVVSAAGG
ncbi:MAG: Flp family type IVb pilin [Sphingomonas sp.]|jgi:pilus assembly protein Flp/PilA